MLCFTGVVFLCIAGALSIFFYAYLDFLPFSYVFSIFLCVFCTISVFICILPVFLLLSHTLSPYLACLVDGQSDGADGYNEDTRGIIMILIVIPNYHTEQLEHVERIQNLQGEKQKILTLNRYINI